MMKDEDLPALEGVGPSLAKKLRSAGITTIEAVVVTPPREMAEKTGIGFNMCLDIAAAARKSVQVGFVTERALRPQEANRRTCDGTHLHPSNLP